MPTKKTLFGLATVLLAAAIGTTTINGRLQYNIAPTTFYVSNGGSDVYNCSINFPCASIQAGVNKAAQHQSSQTIVDVAAGIYAPFYVENFDFRPSADSVNGAGLWIRGALINASITGLQSGTVASYTDFAGSTPSSATVTAAGWGVNALQGLLFKITGGRGAGQIYEIQTNTATVVNLGGAFESYWAGYDLLDNTSTFVIVQPGTHVNGGTLPLPGTGPSGTQFTGVASAGAVVSGVRGGSFARGTFFSGGGINIKTTGVGYAAPMSSLLISGFSFDNAQVGVVVDNSDNVQLRWNFFNNPVTSGVETKGVTRLSLYSNLFKEDAGVSGPIDGGYTNFTTFVAGDSSAPATLIMYGNEVLGSAALIDTTNTQLVSLQAVYTGYNYIYGGGGPCYMVDALSGQWLMWGDQCLTDGNIGMWFGANAVGQGGGVLLPTGVSVTVNFMNGVGYANGNGYGIEVDGPMDCTVSGTGGTVDGGYGIGCFQGCKLGVVSGTLTGTLGDLTLDGTGTGSNAITYASLSTVKYACDAPTGSCIYSGGFRPFTVQPVWTGGSAVGSTSLNWRGNSETNLLSIGLQPQASVGTCGATHTPSSGLFSDGDCQWIQGVTTHPSKLCCCVLTPTGSTYQWQNMGLSNDNAGNTTTCTNTR